MTVGDRSAGSDRPSGPGAFLPEDPADFRMRADLSPRQLACLTLAASGRSSCEIARDLGISVRTVDAHLVQACARLGVRRRVHAVARGVQFGLISGV